MKKSKTIGMALTAMLTLITTLRLFGQEKPIEIDDNYKCSCNIDSVGGLPVFTIAEKMPEFVGGDEARIKFLAENILYPAFKDNEEIQASVYACFIIDTSGNVTNICIFRPKYADHFSEVEKNVMKVIAKMPKWKPAEQNGKTVPMRFTMPVHIAF